LVKNKDIRKFLDGIYVSVKENICWSNSKLRQIWVYNC
jgi:hypothetical protein